MHGLASALCLLVDKKNPCWWCHFWEQPCKGRGSVKEESLIFVIPTAAWFTTHSPAVGVVKSFIGWIWIWNSSLHTWWYWPMLLSLILLTLSDTQDGFLHIAALGCANCCHQHNQVLSVILKLFLLYRQVYNCFYCLSPTWPENILKGAGTVKKSLMSPRFICS